MKIIDPAALATPRSVTCERCGLYTRRPTERHHIYPRKMGGANRMDVVENLTDLGGAFDCGCHVRADAGLIHKLDLLGKVAARLGRKTHQLVEFLERLMAAPKGSDVEAIRAEVFGLACDVCHGPGPLVGGACPRCRAADQETRSML